MRVERKVVGGERHVRLEQGLQSALEHLVDGAWVTLPEETMVNEDQVRVRLGGLLEELEGRGDTGDEAPDLACPGHLHAHRRVVGVGVEIEELVRVGEDLVPVGHAPILGRGF